MGDPVANGSRLLHFCILHSEFCILNFRGRAAMPSPVLTLSPDADKNARFRALWPGKRPA